MDASAGSLSGILDAVYFHPGEYEQCLNLIATNSTKEKGIFKGKYFLINALPQPELLDYREFKHGLTKEMYSDTFSYSIQSRLGLLFQYTNHFVLKVGLCMPSTCERNDLTQSFKQSKHNS